MVKTKQTKATGTRGRPSKRGANDDINLTVDQMSKMSLEVLRLKCQDLKLLTTGKRNQLAERIYEHYHPTAIDPPPEVPLGDDEVQESEETVAYNMTQSDLEESSENDDAEDSGAHAKRRNNGNDRDTTPDPEEEQPQPQRTNLQEIIQAVVESSVGEEVRTMNAQIQAFHSLLTSMKAQQPTPTFIPQSKRTSPTKRRADSDDRRDGTKRPRTTSKTAKTNKNSDSGAGESSSRSSTTGNSKSGTSLSYFLPPITQNAPRNRFRIPAIDKKFIEPIEKGEYVDFDKMKKKRADAKSREANRTDYNLKLHEETSDTTLSLKKSKKDIINNFTEWMAVWNDFLHTRLHFHPDEAYELLKYQKHITDFSKQYKFEAVKNYDIDFRRLVSNEKSYPPSERTAFWDQQNTELKNLLLVDNPKPPPHCYNCTEKGHVSADCPNPSKKQNSNKNNHSGNYYNPNPMPMPTANYPAYYPPTIPTPPVMQNQQPKSGPTSNPVTLDRNDTSNYCRALNATGACPRGFRCRWLHICNRCKQDDGHGGRDCKNHTSTAFRG